MITLFEGEQRNGRIKLTDDRDCLAPDIMRISLRVFSSKREIMDAVRALETRHFCVCLDTKEMFYETARPRCGTKPNTDVLPGFAETLEKEKQSAAIVKAEELALEASTPRNIDAAAGAMETLSPLFRGTAASPQAELFKGVQS